MNFYAIKFVALLTILSSLVDFSVSNDLIQNDLSTNSTKNCKLKLSFNNIENVVVS